MGADSSVVVADFLKEGKGWDTSKLVSSFFPHEVVAILSIDRKKPGDQDERFWNFDEKGRYSVKSGYLFEVGFFSEHESTSSNEIKGWWSGIWAVNIPPKVRIFMWRAVQNLIATDLNLNRRHISSSGLCSWCHKDWGSTVHCLIFCDKTRGAWKKTQWWLVLKDKKFLSLEDLCRVVKESSDEVGFELFCVSLWWTWCWLCKVSHNLDFSVELELVVGCSDFLSSFHEARRKVLTHSSLLPKKGERCWKPPPAGVLRLDSDVSIHGNGEATGVGFIIRDSEGRIVAAAAHRVGRTETVLMGELHALLLGIGFCLENDFGPLLVFTDSLLAVHVVHDDRGGTDSLCDELVEAFAHAKRHIVLDFCHARREANRAAHCLANLATSSSGVMIWKSSFPVWLTDIASRDLI